MIMKGINKVNYSCNSTVIVNVVAGGNGLRLWFLKVYVKIPQDLPHFLHCTLHTARTSIVSDIYAKISKESDGGFYNGGL